MNNIALRNSASHPHTPHCRYIPLVGSLVSSGMINSSSSPSFSLVSASYVLPRRTLGRAQ